ncbi:ATP-binding protein [Maribrevibacterium harenarium]|uniref:ATP-binding protein n=1 Tax=Maribrevibacterium harenarium TaxID=2589817 RepID=A0A501X1I1_9GAMM|nr:ATP-binding protein [Maribrevibacterium harenarium]TPE54266.1 ATP-binding protein [Maribrevibacterium harenarium]
MHTFETAQYIDAEIKEYQGHPLINALPPINSPKDTAELIRRIPVVSPEEVALPAHIRRHAMLRIMDGFLYPTKAHLQLEQTISTMIRQGYLSRNIANKSYQETLNRTEKLTDDTRNAGNEALVSSVIGCSGAGKSTAVEAVLSGYPQVITHPTYQHVQIVWLKVECPHDASVKSLCINFFRALDEALDNNGLYEKQYVKPRANTEMLLGDFARIAALHSIGLLVIDEIQHLERSSSSNVSDRILRFFVQLTNTIKLPILFVGTPKAYELLATSMRSARRASQFGSINWNRFNTTDRSGKGSDWDRFFSQLWVLQWFKSPQPLTDEVKTLFWDYSQGIAHVAVTLFYLCQTRAVTVGREVISRDLVETVFNEELHMIKPMIRALQSGRDAEIQKYDDLEIPRASIVQIAVATATANDVAENDTSEEYASPEQSKLSKLIGMLEQAGIGGDIAPTVAEQAVSEHPDANLFQLLAHINNLQDKEQAPPVKEKSTVFKLVPKYVENDLRLMVNSKGGTYKTMKSEGVVLHISDYL